MLSMFLYYHTNSRGLYSSDKNEICLREDRFRTAEPINSNLEIGFSTSFVEVSKNLHSFRVWEHMSRGRLASISFDDDLSNFDNGKEIERE